MKHPAFFDLSPDGKSFILGLCVFFASTGLLCGQVFVESSAEVGLSHTLVPLGNISSGLAVFDYDDDGDDDIYVVGGREPDALYQNDGTGNFVNVASELGIAALTDGVVTQSVVTGDLDNDGIREIYVGTYQQSTSSGFQLAPNLLLRFNEATGRYEDTAFSSGLSEPRWTTGPVFFDANLDGFLDLYETDYISSAGFIRDTAGTVTGFSHECGSDRFWLGNGDGTFTEASGLFGGGNSGCGLAAIASDTDNDADQDLIVINDFGEWVEPDALYQNDLSSGTFTDNEATSSFRNRHYGMGIAAGDVNEDLLMDYYITNIGRNAFMLNQGNNVFTRAEGSYRITDEFTNFGNFTTGWGTFFADLNNDTYLDLFVGNGFVNSAVDVDDSRQSDKIYRGLPEERFFDATSTSGITDTLTTRGAVYADLNSDGLLDILVLTNDGGFFPNKLRYYRNVTETSGNYLAVRLSSDEGNRDAYGSTVTLYADNRAFLRELSGGGSHASQHSSLLHFGLGDITTVDSVAIRWPDGRVGRLYDPEINRVHEIARGDLVSPVRNWSHSRPFRISPNPATNLITLTGSAIGGSYQIMNLNGSIVQAGMIRLPDNSIRLNSLRPGMYILRSGQAAERFIVR